jgi:3-oxoacyl-[acyl-carrier protein] reductase
MRMEGLRCLVIGGGGAGIDRGITRAYAQAGASVAVAGVLSLARTVAAEYAADQIRMNVVAAGAVSTAVAASAQTSDEIARIPVGRFGTVADVAAAAVYLGSAESSYLTGQQVVVDGGVSVRGPFG